VSDAAEIEQSTGRLLAQYQAMAQQAATNTAVEMQHILAMLNRALMVLSGGSERSVSRLRQVQESLQRASMLEDLIALKSSLTDTIRFVQEESVREQQTAAKEFAAFEVDVEKARTFLGSNFKGLPGRPEGVRAISEEIKAVAASQALYVVAFLFDRLEAIVQRYGPEVADELMYRLIKERLQPVAPVNKAFRWTSSSVIGVFPRNRDLSTLRAQLIALNRTPLVHRVALGSRVAVLTVSPSYLVAEAVSDSPNSLIEEVDRFTGIHVPGQKE
jgi:hypothetical protein